MAPRPFPFPLGVGVDVCRIDRIARILRHEHFRNRWAHRTFTRLEWPEVCRRFERANRPQGTSNVEIKPGREGMSDGEVEDNLWMLPGLTEHTAILGNDEEFKAALADERSSLRRLACFFAGR